MKKTLVQTFIILVALFVNNTQAQQYSWRHMNGPLGGIIGDIAIDSKDNLYAGVYGNWIWYSGLFKSTDNGDTWFELKTETEDIEVYSIYVNKSGDIFVGTNWKGMHRSTDDGASWKKIGQGYTSGECWAFGENKFGIMFAGDAQYQKMFKSSDYGNTWSFVDYISSLEFARDSNGNMYVGTLNSLLRSTNDGISWQLNLNFTNTSVSCLLIDEKDEIVIGTGYGPITGKGIFKTTDYGNSWELLGLTDKKNILALAYDSVKSIYAGAGYDGLFKSTNGGETWELKNKGLERRHVFRVRLNSKDHIFIGSEDEGVYRSTDGGLGFEQIGLPVSRVENVDFDKEGKYVFAATPTGVQRYNRQKGKWENKGLYKVKAISVSPIGDLYAATYSDGIFRSEDKGETWIQTAINSDSGLAIWSIKAIEDSLVFAATTRYLRRSTNKGVSWDYVNVNTGSTCSIILGQDKKIYLEGYIQFKPYVFMSDDRGESFVSLIEIPDESMLNDLAVDSKGTLYFSARGLPSSQGLHRSKLPYQNWERMLDGLGFSVEVIKNDIIYAAMQLGIFQSTDGGENWQLIFNEKMPRTFATELEVDKVGKLYVGTDGYGLFEVQTSTSAEDNQSKVINKFFLDQNYPNPFNSNTNIIYQLPVGGQVSLKVYDILGRELTTLVNEEKQAGSYSVNFDSSSLPSGVYIYRIRTGNYTASKKMVLAR